MKSPSKVQKSDDGIITTCSTERMTFLFSSWLPGLWSGSIIIDTWPIAMKEIVQELTIASERFLRVRYTVRVGAPLVGLRWLGHYHLQNKDYCTLKVHASNQNHTYIVQNRYRYRMLRKCLQKLSQQWTWTVFFTGTALHQKYVYPEVAFLQVENVKRKKIATD